MNLDEIQSVKNRFGIIGNSPLLNHAIHVAIQVAATEMTVLITGESGTGKESFSKIIHQLSARKHGQFIAINCGAIPEGTIDSELFGHEKGSFTGAVDSRKGYFEVTDGGTIFLDEIGEMPLGTQARLLRVLENGEFIRVGSSKVQKTNVRVVAATNVKLLQAVDKGQFREDLYYRLNTVPIFVPPLHERGDDVELLFRKFATDFAEKNRVKPIRLTDDAKSLLKKQRFRGNIRQLKNLVEQMSLLESEKNIDEAMLKSYLPNEGNKELALWRGEGSEKGSEGSFSERDLLYKVLFDMKSDVNELKGLVFTMLKTHPYGGELLKMNTQLFNETLKPVAESRELAQPLTTQKDMNPSLFFNDHTDDGNDTIDLNNFDIHEHEDDSLSLDHKEKELIIKALKKNNNKRKYAAQDLGISERTLYRKIKELGLEE